MPGILPMKMIRVGSNNQSRIAQACDRCRSKKIRCDGIRPCCSQCANVGFECKTSDKLSRRAFPRGYTESLEDRVRGLEAEVRELKQLLDEKDEKLDMLSRIHSFSPASRKASASLSPNTAAQVKAEVTSNSEELLHVEIPAPVEPTGTSPGTSTTCALIESFEGKVREQGRNCPKISPVTLLSPAAPAVRPTPYGTNTSVAPPRLLSDQYINLYFQEWQPLLPILHRHTFLRVYEQFLSASETDPCSNKIATAQLFLIFEIAAHSASSKAKPITAAYELEWRKALSSVSSAPSLDTLQCHILAQLCYLLKADYPHLLRHRAYAVSLTHQLGLHQAHKCHYVSAFEAETRKKVFWCQYTLDKFASAVTGMPMLLRDVDITSDWPADVDDEYINPQGLCPALPGEVTKMSSALSLFKISRILAKALEHLYPAGANYSLSITKLHSLSDELDQWHEELPDHLRLRFCNDKPATNMTSDRSPLLSLAYFFTRSLIHRPLLCHGSGSAAAAAMIVLAAAGKHILQIIDLLDERSMNYTFPVNKQDTFMSAGFSILWQCLDLDEDGRLVKDNQKSLNLLLVKLAKENNNAGSEFRSIAAQFVPVGNTGAFQPRHIEIDTPASRMLSSMPAPQTNKQKTTRKQLQAIASRFPSFSGKGKPDEPPRRATAPTTATTTAPCPRTSSNVSLASTQSAPAMQICTPSPKPTTPEKPGSNAASAINLDYFPLGGMMPIPHSGRTMSTSVISSKQKSAPRSKNSSWEHLVIELDNAGDSLHSVSSTVQNKTVSSPETLDWTDDMWHLGNVNASPKNPVPQSLLSFSEESLTSGDDFMFSAPVSHNGSTSTSEAIDAAVEQRYKGITMPVSNEDDLDFHQAIAA